MSGLRAIPRSSFALILSALMLSTSIMLAAVYTARGDNHDQTYYACLYAGSLSQVNTTAPPTNCGRGQQVQWTSAGAITPVDPTIAYVHDGNFAYIGDSGAAVASITVPAGSYVISGSANVINTDANPANAYCGLGGLGANIQFEQRVYLGGVDDPASSQNISVVGWATVTETTTITLYCQVPTVPTQSAQSLDQDLAAVSVASIVPSGP